LGEEEALLPSVGMRKSQQSFWEEGALLTHMGGGSPVSFRGGEKVATIILEGGSQINLCGDEEVPTIFLGVGSPINPRGKKEVPTIFLGRR
jgi:hypothetical protein